MTCPGFFTAFGAMTGALIGGGAGGFGGAAGGSALCSPTVLGAIPCGVAGAAAGGSAGAIKGAAVGAAVGAAIDGAVMMARAGKGRGGNQNPNEDVHRIVDEHGLNRAGRRKLHDMMSKKDFDLDDIADMAAELAKQAKYLRNPPPAQP